MSTDSIVVSRMQSPQSEIGHSTYRPFLETQSLAVLLPDQDLTLIRVVGCLSSEDVDALEAILAAGEQWFRSNQRMIIDLEGLSLFDSRQFERVVAACRSNEGLLRASLSNAVFVYPSNLIATVTLLTGCTISHGGFRVSQSLPEACRLLDLDLESCLQRVHPGARKAWDRLAAPGARARLSDEVASFLSSCPPETSLDDAAVHLSTSRRTLQRALQEEGITFRDLRRRARMERAKFLLAESNMKLLAIALDIGFRKTAQLRKLFLEEVSMGPSEWRRAARHPSTPPRVVLESGFPPPRIQEAESA
jgi:AraC-like DNA-binding protein